MTRYRSSQEWLEQSKLLLEDRPTTTKVTMKYSVKAAKTPKSRKAPANPDATDSPMPDADTTPKPPRGVLVIKTYDPVGGVVLKYHTNKATEVTRLMYALAQFGRTMAAIPDDTAEQMPDAPAAALATEASQDPGEAAAAAGTAAQTQTVPQGGGKKRRKGKK